MRKIPKLILFVGAALMLFTVTVATTAAPGSDGLKFNVVFTWDLGLRLGIDYRPWDHVGFAANVGSTLFSFEEGDGFILSGDASVMYHVSDPAEPFQLSAGFGIPDWRMVFTDPFATEVSFGASGRAAYQFDGWGPFVRLGAGVPLFWEGDDFSVAGTTFPLGLWPDVAVGAQIDLR
jgi:hypothetical protein